MLACLQQNDLAAFWLPKIVTLTCSDAKSYGKASSTGLNRCLLCRLLSLGQLQHHSQASKLRVIVGRGNNSSGGEASLPRVVESHLLQRNMSYIAGQGIITVYLRGLRH